MAECTELLADDADVRAAYARAHESYLADRESIARRRRDRGLLGRRHARRVKCLHALAGHALAAGPGVNPIGDLALERSTWSPDASASAPTTASTRPIRRARRRASRRAVARRVVARRGALALALVRRRRSPSPAPRRRTPTPCATSSTGSPTTASRRRGARRAGAGVTVAVIDTGVDGDGRRAARAPSSAARTSRASAAPTGRPRSATGRDARHAWSPRCSPGAARATGNGVIGVAPEATCSRVSVAFGQDSGSTVSTTTRSPTPCAGRSTTAPTSSTCR